MSFVVNSIFIDIIIVFVLVLMLIFGYIKGFVYRAYDLLATIISLLIALYASSPLSNIYTVYKVEGLGEMIGETVNRFIIFIILFIVLKMILLLLGKVVKPLLKNIIYTFSIFEQLDRLLGIVVSLIGGIINIYLALIFIVMPIIPGGKESIDDTVVAKKILELVPAVTEKIESLDTVGQIISEGINYDSLNNAYDNGLINQEELENTLVKYYDDIDEIQEPVSLDQQQYDEVSRLLSKVDRSKIDVNKILSKIIVSE